MPSRIGLCMGISMGFSLLPITGWAEGGANASISGASGAFASLAEAPSPEFMVPGWRLGLEQAVARQTNPLRQVEGSGLVVPDRVLTRAADASTTWAMGRQAWSAWARVERTVYGRLEALDHDAHAAQVSWDARWAADLATRLWWRRQDDLADAWPRLDLPSGQRVQQRIDQSGVQAEWGLQRRWAVQTGLQRDEVQDTVPGQGSARVAQDTFSAGLLWRGPGPFTAGVGRREIRGRQQRVQLSPLQDQSEDGRSAVDYAQHLWDVQGRWTISPGRWMSARWSTGQGDGGDADGTRSPLAPELTQNKRLHSLRLDLRWLLRPTISLVARAWRDEGLQAQVLQAIGEDARLWATSASAVRDARLELHWDVAPRLRVAAAAQRLSRQDLRGLSITQAQAQAGEQALQTLRDRTQRAQFTTSWRPRKAWSLACSALSEKRQAWIDQAASTTPAPGHTARAVSCVVRAEWGGNRLIDDRP